MKKFLENNKIYFEIFSLSFLGLMAVIVSFTQWRTANQEFELHRSENMPIFLINYDQAKLDSTYKFDTEILKVSNEGKIVKSFDKEFFSFYIFKVRDLDNPKNEERNIYVPVSDYFAVSYNSTNRVGELFQSLNKGNLSKLIATEDYCQQTLFYKKHLLVTPTRHVYFKFDFTDISNNKNAIYLNTSGEEISKAEYNQTKSKLSRFNFGVVTINDITHNFIDSITNLKE